MANRVLAEAYWNSVITAIESPPADKTSWCVQAKKLALVIVEPRAHKWLAGVLYRMAEIYGGSEVGLYIFYGTKNLDYIKSYTGSWSGVNYMPLGKDNLTIKQYSHLLTSASFYQNFSSQHILIFQTDTYIRRPIDEIYFNYNWCGAAWMRHAFWVTRNNCCGNGGFSLRNVKRMIDICRLRGPTEQNEDIFFNRLLSNSEYPTDTLQQQFSVEAVFHPDPCGLHAPYKFLTVAQLKQLLA